MQPSPLTIGITMIGLCLIVSIMALRGEAPVDPLALVAVVPLVVGGVAMLFRRPVSFWVAVSAGLFTAVAGLCGMVLHRQIGLPLQPLVVMVIGLYVCFRITIARSALLPRPPRRMIADDVFDAPDPRA